MDGWLVSGVGGTGVITIAQILAVAVLAASNAAIPQEIRGFGHHRRHSIDTARRKEAELLAQFR